MKQASNTAPTTIGTRYDLVEVLAVCCAVFTFGSGTVKEIHNKL